MKKNGEYVGVDERYIPEDEKYVDESSLGKNGAKKYGKIAIGCLIAFLGFIVVFMVGFFLFFFNIFSNTNKVIDGGFGLFDKIFNKAETEMNELEEEFESEYSKMDIKMFNNNFEHYAGSNSKFFVESLLDEVNTNNKTESDHIISVVYNGVTTSNTVEITNIKYTLDDSKKYEVSLDYDTNGFVNKVSIVAIEN